MRKINKRGFWMGEEAGKFILGVIAVFLLFLLAFKLVGIMQQNTKHQQARIAMEEIEQVINSLKDGETGTVFIESPKDWFLVSYNKSKNQAKIPNTCGGENCLCLCPLPKEKREKISSGNLNDYWSDKSKGLDECEKRGLCIRIEKESIIQGKTQVVTSVGGGGRVSSAKTKQLLTTNFIEFNTVPIELKIKSQIDNKINITNL